jgi:hypothetical protein
MVTNSELNLTRTKRRIKMSHKPGGGYASNKVVHHSVPKQEPKPHAINEAAVSQIGVKVAFVKDQLERGRGYATPVGPTKSVAGPGGGRDIHPSGGQHGLNKNPQPLPPGRDPLNQE